LVLTVYTATPNGNANPLSAVAAAKLRLQQKQDPEPPLDAPVNTTPEAVSSDLSQDEPEQDAPLPQRNVQLCTWRYGQDYITSESADQLTVSLKKNATITLIGCFDFAVLKGAININGANFGAGTRKDEAPSTRRAFVPSTHPISTIRGLDGQNEIQFLDCDEPTPFERLSPLFADIWNAKSQDAQSRSFSLITNSDADPLRRNIVPEIVSDDWTSQIEECTRSPSITFVIGKPSSGKSTFVRRLLNRYLTGLGKLAKAIPSVYLLDLNGNKPAYSPHGQVSLVLVREVGLGPEFTHSASIPQAFQTNEIIRAHSTPGRSILNFPEHFVACTEDLFHKCAILRQQNPSIPLVVNLPGWLYANSFNTIIQLISQLRPQRVVNLTDLESIDEGNAAKLDALDDVARKSGIQVSHISAQPAYIDPSRTQSELKDMQMLSHFHCTGLNNSDPPQRTYSAKPLSFTTPWEFYYEKTPKSQQTFVGFLMLSEWIDPSQIMAVLNGSIIQIVETFDASILSRFENLPRAKNSRIPFFEKGEKGGAHPLDPGTSRLVCTALLRGFDPTNRVAQVVVPKPYECLLGDLKPERTVFVFGCCEHPEWAYKEDAYYRTSEQTKEVHLGERIAVETMTPPWVHKASAMEEMGYLNTVRRVRKFQQ
jgi:polynucleotide 5'-hydroxyl-kinase GRC3/NOL9